MDNHLRLADGYRIPRDGTKSMKEVVESLKQQKGILKLPESSGFFQDRANAVENFSQAQNFADKDSEAMRMLNEMLQRVGIDAVQRALSSQNFTSQSSRTEEDEWEQNFD